jgi:hypothetical protein
MRNNDGCVLSSLKASTTLWSCETTAEKRWGSRRLSPCGYRPDSKHNTALVSSALYKKDAENYFNINLFSSKNFKINI